MEDICTYFPHPTAHGPFLLADGGEIRVTKGDQQAAGFVFKTLSDPYVGRLSFVKIFSGNFVPGMELVNARTRKKERLGHVCIMKGKETMDVKSAMAGDIVVIPVLPKPARATRFPTRATSPLMLCRCPSLCIPWPLRP